MILGLSLSAFTTLHVIISLIAIAAGFVVLVQMFGARRSEGWTAFFLATTVLTSVTGFMFPLKAFGAPHAVGVISMILLAVAIAAWYGRHLSGSWRWIYVATAIASLYLNVFVGVVQAFQKLPPLTALAPTQTEVPYLITQIVVLAAFVWLGISAVRRFHPAELMPA